MHNAIKLGGVIHFHAPPVMCAYANMADNLMFMSYVHLYDASVFLRFICIGVYNVYRTLTYYVNFDLCTISTFSKEHQYENFLLQKTILAATAKLQCSYDSG